MTNANRIGEKQMMNCGVMAEIIDYRNAKDIDVKFEDGYIRKNIRYDNFKRGKVTYGIDYKLGESNNNYQGLKMEIIQYFNANNVTIKFEDGTIKTNVNYSCFKKGSVKNNNFSSIYNVGYLGNVKITDDNGNRLKSYDVWFSMLQRCYDEKNRDKYPTYKNCEVCDEWKCYDNFKKWYDENYYEIENEKICLDKDIMFENNKIYSPKTCIFVPHYINSLFSGHNKKTDLPKGVYLDEDKYRSKINIFGNTEYLGRFDTIEEAQKVYNNKRKELLVKVIEKYKNKIPQKLQNRLIEISNNIN